MKRFILLLSLMATALFIIPSGTTVFADSTRVSGQLNKGGHLVQYNYTRTKQGNGRITLTVDDMPTGNLRLGLRDMNRGGVQFTNTLQWNAKGTQSWENILGGTRFALQGRMPATSSLFADINWGGELTY